MRCVLHLTKIALVVGALLLLIAGLFLGGGALNPTRTLATSILADADWTQTHGWCLYNGSYTRPDEESALWNQLYGDSPLSQLMYARVMPKSEVPECFGLVALAAACEEDNPSLSSLGIGVTTAYQYLFTGSWGAPAAFSSDVTPSSFRQKVIQFQMSQVSAAVREARKSHTLVKSWINASQYKAALRTWLDSLKSALGPIDGWDGAQNPQIIDMRGPYDGKNQGHSVVAFDVSPAYYTMEYDPGQERDDLWYISVYDSNYPGSTRLIEVNLTDGVWSYDLRRGVLAWGSNDAGASIGFLDSSVPESVVLGNHPASLVSLCFFPVLSSLTVSDGSGRTAGLSAGGSWSDIPDVEPFVISGISFSGAQQQQPLCLSPGSRAGSLQYSIAPNASGSYEAWFTGPGTAIAISGQGGAAAPDLLNVSADASSIAVHPGRSESANVEVVTSESPQLNLSVSISGSQGGNGNGQLAVSVSLLSNGLSLTIDDSGALQSGAAEIAWEGGQAQSVSVPTDGAARLELTGGVADGGSGDAQLVVKIDSGKTGSWQTTTQATLAAPGSTASSGFPDVPASHKYYAAITGLALRNIIGGYANGNFGPSDPVTRQQFAKMIVLTGGYPVSEGDVCRFSDVAKSDAATFYPDNYVAVCAAKGITTGKTATTFDPSGKITRYQVVSMVVRAADNLQPGLLAQPSAAWVGNAKWASDVTHGANAARAEFNGLLAGLDLATLSPDSEASRGEVAQLLYNLIRRIQSAGTGPQGTGTPASSAGGFMGMAAGIGHSLALGADGSLWGWGYNHAGQVGDGTVTSRNAPACVDASTNWVAVSARGPNSMGLKTGGSLWAWGYNGRGQVGDGTNTDRRVPTRIGSDEGWASVSTGGWYSLALKTDGSLWGWGYNYNGQVGDGTNEDRPVPTRIASSTDWRVVSAGWVHSLGIKVDGTLWAWGRNAHGELGDGSTIPKLMPAQVDMANDWMAVSAGASFSIALKTNGSLWAWGYNNEGQLGTTTSLLTPTRVGTATDWLAISAGENYCLAIKRDGSLWAWGQNDVGQLGDGTTINRDRPARIGLGNDWKAVCAGGNHTFGLKSDGSLWAWGSNGDGALGDGTYTNRLVPTIVAGGPK